MYVKDLFSLCSWSPVIFGWIYQTCLFRDFWSRPWSQEAPFRILVLSLSRHNARWSCTNTQPLGRLCMWRPALGWGLSGALAYCKCSSRNVHLQLGSSTSNPKHDTAQTSSYFLLTAGYSKLWGFSAWKAWDGEDDRAVLLKRPLWFPWCPMRSGGVIRRCYSNFSARGHRCLKGMKWLCTVYEDEQLPCCSRSTRHGWGRWPDLHRP